MTVSSDFTWSGTKDFAAGLMPEVDFDTYLSGDVGFVYYNQPPMFFMATDAIFPTGSSTDYLPASSTDIESANGPRMSLVELAYEAPVVRHAAQWNFRSWFSSSDVSGIKFHGFVDNTLVSTSTDNLEVVIDIAAISSGDASINTKSLSGGGGGITSATLYRTSYEGRIGAPPASSSVLYVIPSDAYTFFEATLAVADTNTWDGVATGDMCTLHFDRSSTAIETTNLFITRAWIY